MERPDHIASLVKIANIAGVAFNSHDCARLDGRFSCVTKSAEGAATDNGSWRTGERHVERLGVIRTNSFARRWSLSAVEPSIRMAR